MPIFQSRQIGRDLARADRVLSNYKDVSIEDIKREFEGKTRNSKGKEKDKTPNTAEENRKYYQAYMLKKYGENVRDYAEESNQYAEVYGLDEKTNPYIEFVQDIIKSGNSKSFPRNLAGKRIAKVLFSLVDSGDESIDDPNFHTFLNNIRSNDEDFNAFYVQAVSWLLNSEKMKKWRPSDPGLKNLTPNEQQALTDIFSGTITDKQVLDSKINSLAKNNSPVEDESTTKRKYIQDRIDEISYEFSRLTPAEQKEFARIANQIGINLSDIGIRNA